MDRIMLHSDMNNYFASVECIDNPRLRNVPMAVCGDPSTRHGIILAKNQIAKSKGIMTGESTFSAQKKVPDLTMITADYSKYLKYTNLSREIYKSYSNIIIPYGMDEAWIDLSNKVNDLNSAVKIAEEIRERVKSELKLTVSIGVSYNYIFSKLASDMKKPDVTTLIEKKDLKTIIWNPPAFELLFVGPATRKKLHQMNILTIGDLANANVNFLHQMLGKNGDHLWQFANGNDSSFNPIVSEEEMFKSIGNTITSPKNLDSEDDILSMLYILSKTVSLRLKKHNLKAKCISILIKKSNFEIINRQITIDMLTDNENIIYTNVKKLLKDNYFGDTPIRSLGVHTSNLHNSQTEQLSMFGEENNIDMDLKNLITNLKNKLGEFDFEKSATYGDPIININKFLEE